MTDATTIIPFRQPGSILDPLTEIARDGARRMLIAALKAEADSFVAQFSEDRLADGCQRVVRHGAGPERVIQTGIGPIEVRRQKVRDPLPGSRMHAFDERGASDLPVAAKIRFTPEHPSEMGASVQKPRCPAAGALPARHLHRRFPGSCLPFLGQTRRT